MPEVYGYARCSTTEKRQDVERQVAELYAMGAGFVVQEYESGGNPSRKGFDELLGLLNVGDTLCATELSRVTRSLRHLCDIIEVAKSKNLLMRFGSAVFEFAEGKSSPFSLAMLQMMGVFAELERNLAADRINSGLAHAKANGVRLGRPKKTAAEVPARVLALWPDFASNDISAAKFARLAGVSRPSIYKYIRLLQGVFCDGSSNVEGCGGNKSGDDPSAI